MSIRLLMLIFIGAVMVSCSTTMSSIHIRRAAEINPKKLGTVAFVVNDFTGEEIYTRTKECIPETDRESVSGGVSKENAAGSASASFSITSSKRKPIIIEKSVPQDELNEYRKIVISSIQQLKNRVPDIQIVPQNQAETVITINGAVKKSKSWGTKKTTSKRDVGIAQCYSVGPGNPKSKLDVEFTFNVSRNGEEVQTISKSVGGRIYLPRTTGCYFNPVKDENDHWREPDELSTCVTNDVDPATNKYLSTSVDFKEWFNTMKAAAVSNIEKTITNLFIIVDEDVPVTFFKISKPAGVEQANDFMASKQWEQAKSVYDRVVKSVGGDMEQEEKGDFYYNYAIALMGSGKYEKAIDMIKKALDYYQKDEYQKLMKIAEELYENDKKLKEQSESGE